MKVPFYLLLWTKTNFKQNRSLTGAGKLHITTYITQPISFASKLYFFTLYLMSHDYTDCAGIKITLPRVFSQDSSCFVNLNYVNKWYFVLHETQRCDLYLEGMTILSFCRNLLLTIKWNYQWYGDWVFLVHSRSPSCDNWCLPARENPLNTTN